MQEHRGGGTPPPGQPLIRDLTEQLGADMGALLACCQEQNRLLEALLAAQLPGSSLLAPALAPSVSPSPFLEASVRIPTAGGDLAVGGNTDFILELEEGVTMASIAAIFAIASANTIFSLYLYDRPARSQWDLFYIDEDIVLPAPPIDAVLQVTTARMDVNSIGWPGLLWRSAESNRRIYGRIRNQVGGAISSFILRIYYVPLIRPQ